MNTTNTVFQKFLAGVSAGAIAISSIAIAPLASAGTFPDVADDRWSAPYIEALVDQGVLAGNPDGTFRPEANLNRAEFAKVAVNIAMNSGLINSMEVAADAPTFTDVAAGQWFTDYVRLAADYGIFSGYADASGKLTGEFGPSNNVTRAEASKVLLLASMISETELSGKSAGFPDVQPSDWFYNYVTTAYWYSILDGYQNGLFGPNDPVTREQIAKIAFLAQEENRELRAGAPVEDDTTTPGEDDDTTTPGEDDEDDTTTPGTGGDLGGDPSIDAGDLNVRLSSDNNVLAPAASVPVNAANVPYLVLDITASADEDFLLQQLVVTRRGIGSPNDFNNVNIYLDGVRQGSGRTFTRDNNSATFTFAGRPITIPAGTTSQLSVRADLANVGNSENYFEIAKASDIVAAGKDSGGSVDVLGSFPISGNTLRTVNVDAGTLAVTGGTNPASKVTIGENQVAAGQINLSSNSQQDMLITSITLENKGTAGNNDISNVTLYDASTKEKIAGPVNLDGNDRAYFDLSILPDGGYLLGDGDRRRIDIKVDVKDGINETINFGLDEASDIVAIGQTYGFGVLVNGAFNKFAATDVNIEGGNLTFDFDKPERTEIAVNKQDVVLGYLNIANRGEPVLVRDLTLTMTRTNPTIAAITDADKAKVYFKSLKLVSPDGKTLSGPVDPTNFALSTNNLTAKILFNDDFTIPSSAETKRYILMGDTGTGLAEGERYDFKFTPLSADLRAEGLTTRQELGAGDLQNAVIASDTLEVQDERLTVTLASTPVSASVIRGTTARVFGVVVRAGDAGDVRLTGLNFAKSGTHVASDVTEFVLVDESGNVLDSDARGNVSPTFDRFAPVTVAAGTQKTFYVEAKVASAAVENNEIALKLALSPQGVVAEDMDGDALTQNQLYTGVAVAPAGTELNGAAARKFTVKNAGTLLVERSTSTPASKQYVLGSDLAPVFSFQVRAQDETMDVRRLEISAIDANQAKQIDQLTLRVGGTDVSTVTMSENRAVFTIAQGQLKVTGTTTIDLVAKFNTGVNGAAKAGENMQLYVRSIEVEGTKSTVRPGFGAGAAIAATFDAETKTATMSTAATVAVGDLVVLADAANTEHVRVIADLGGGDYTVERMLDKTSVAVTTPATITHIAGIKSNPFVGQYSKLGVRAVAAGYQQTTGTPNPDQDLFRFVVSAKTVANSGSVAPEVSKIRVRANASSDVTIAALRLYNGDNNQLVGSGTHLGSGLYEFDLTVPGLPEITADAQATARKFNINSGTSAERTFYIRGNLTVNPAMTADTASVSFSIPNLGNIASTIASNVGIEWKDIHQNHAGGAVDSVDTFWVDLDDNATSITQSTGPVFTK